jgi:hypothetical protein
MSVSLFFVKNKCNSKEYSYLCQMIFYFSCTGNTRWAAEMLSTELQEELVDMAHDSRDSYHLEEDERIGQREADGKDEDDVAKPGYALAGEDVVLVAYESRDADDVEHHEDEASQDHPLRYRPKQCGAPPQRLPSNDTSASGDGRLGPLRWEALPAR